MQQKSPIIFAVLSVAVTTILRLGGCSKSRDDGVGLSEKQIRQIEKLLKKHKALPAEEELLREREAPPAEEELEVVVP